MTLNAVAWPLEPFYPTIWETTLNNLPLRALRLCGKSGVLRQVMLCRIFLKCFYTGGHARHAEKPFCYSISLSSSETGNTQTSLVKG